jgi:hypothetical protein
MGLRTFFLDNAKAFDRVQWSFLQHTLEGLGFPDELRHIVRTMYSGALTCTKVNGHKSKPWGVTSGVRQGCPLSAALFLIVQEVQLHMLRTDTRIRGIEIPGPSGSNEPGQTSTLLERCLADDMAIGIEKLEMYAHVNEQLERFSYISDHAVNYSKSYVLLLGKHRARAQHLADDTPTHPDDPRHIDDRINWTTLETFTDKYHGVRLTDAFGAKLQWEAIEQGVIQQAESLRHGQRRSNTEHRIAYLKMCVISKIVYSYSGPVAWTLTVWTW